MYVCLIQTFQRVYVYIKPQEKNRIKRDGLKLCSNNFRFIFWKDDDCFVFVFVWYLVFASFRCFCFLTKPSVSPSFVDTGTLWETANGHVSNDLSMSQTFVRERAFFQSPATYSTGNVLLILFITRESTENRYGESSGCSARLDRWENRKHRWWVCRQLNNYRNSFFVSILCFLKKK